MRAIAQRMPPRYAIICANICEISAGMRDDPKGQKMFFHSIKLRLRLFVSEQAAREGSLFFSFWRVLFVPGI